MAKAVYAKALFYQFSAAFDNLRYESSPGGELRVRVKASGGAAPAYRWYSLDCSKTPTSGAFKDILHTIEYDGCIFHWCSILYGWECPVCVKGL